MKYAYYDFESLFGAEEHWFKTSKYSIKINLNYWNSGIKSLNGLDDLCIHDVDYSVLKVDSLSIYDKSGKKTTIDIELAHKVLPHIKDMIDYVHLLSDRIINEKLEKLLKLKVFL